MASDQTSARLCLRCASTAPAPPPSSLSGCLGAPASTSTIYNVHRVCGAPGHRLVVAALLQRGHAKVELLHGPKPVLQPAQRGLLRLAPLGG